MLRTLTHWEVQEFIEQVRLRKHWIGKDMLWIRKQNGVNQFAVKFVNGLPHNMSTMHVKALAEQAESEIDRYLDWLLGKITSYGWRIQIESLLYARLGDIRQADYLEDRIEAIARDITTPSGIPSTSFELQSYAHEAPLTDHLDSVEQYLKTDRYRPVEPEELVIGHETSQCQALKQPFTTVRSKHLENLLRKRNR